MLKSKWMTQRREETGNDKKQKKEQKEVMRKDKKEGEVLNTNVRCTVRYMYILVPEGQGEQ